MNQGSWTIGGAGSAHPKRPHQLIAEASDNYYLPIPNKKQALQVLDNNVNDNSNNNNHNVYIGMLNSNVPLLATSPSFHPCSTQFSYESESANNVGFDDRYFSSTGADKMNMGYGLNENPFGSVSSFNMCIPHISEGPRSSPCFKKVRVSEVLLSGTTFSTDPADNNHTHDKGDDDNIQSIGGDVYQRIQDRHAISLSSAQTYKESLPAPADVYLDRSYKPTASNMSSSLIYDKAPETTMTTSRRGESFLSAGHSGVSTIISFGGSVDDYDEILAGLSPTLKNEATHVEALVDLGYRNPSKKKRDDNKSSKKVASNNFPPNVRCLLSTGILDGVPVKYIAWSRELPGVIKGCGYLCGCHSCKYSKVINAFEFERHAGCKTKHPNNHIYFENGKTIYGAVQELKSTPQNMLLDAIQNVAGSPINQDSFRLWKVSFLAATSELKRIYAHEDVKQSF